MQSRFGAVLVRRVGGVNRNGKVEESNAASDATSRPIYPGPVVSVLRDVMTVTVVTRKSEKYGNDLYSDSDASRVPTVTCHVS